MRLVEISTNTGKVLRVYGIHFPSDVAAYAYAREGLGLPSLDLDAPLWWPLSLNRAVTIDHKDAVRRLS